VEYVAVSVGYGNPSGEVKCVWVSPSWAAVAFIFAMNAGSPGP
jgi:hypothetical protein